MSRIKDIEKRIRNKAKAAGYTILDSVIRKGDTFVTDFRGTFWSTKTKIDPGLLVHACVGTESSSGAGGLYFRIILLRGKGGKLEGLNDFVCLKIRKPRTKKA